MVEISVVWLYNSATEKLDVLDFRKRKVIESCYPDFHTTKAKRPEFANTVELSKWAIRSLKLKLTKYLGRL